jgi:hypothetical protein
VADQSEKLGRARRATVRAATALGLNPDDPSSVPAKEATLSEMREVTRSMLGELAALAAQHPQAGIAALAEQCGLKLPAPTATGAASAGSYPGTPPSTAGRGNSRPGSSSSAALLGGGGGSVVTATGRSAARPGSRGGRASAGPQVVTVGL